MEMQQIVAGWHHVTDTGPATAPGYAPLIPTLPFMTQY